MREWIEREMVESYFPPRWVLHLFISIPHLEHIFYFLRLHYGINDLNCNKRLISILYLNLGESGKLWQPSDRSVVCSEHFAKEDYREDCKIRLLKVGSIPSIFPKYPKYKQGKSDLPRRSLKRNTTQIQTVRAKKLKNNFDDGPANHVNNEPIENTGVVKTACENEIQGQKKFRSAVLAHKNRQILSLKRSNRRLKSRVKILRARVKELRQNYNVAIDKIKELNIPALEAAMEKEDIRALFLREQLQALGQMKHRWSELSVRYCVLWQSKSSSAYDFVRNAPLLILPSRSTLKRYTGACTKENTMGLISQRLSELRNSVRDEETLGSLIIDDMAIRPDVQYIKSGDAVIGTVDMDGLEKNSGQENNIATQLTCFIFQGLATHFVIPVHYFFTNNVTGKELKELTLKVIVEVENSGFKVIRIVTDNHSTNVKMFSELCEGSPRHEIPHPCDFRRPLFLSYDYCHIIKNVRNMFLDSKRSLTNNGKSISPKYRVIHLIRSATDGCRSRPCLSCPPLHAALNCRCS